MSTETKEVLSILEQLPEAKRVEVADFARFLLQRSSDEASSAKSFSRWLEKATGASNTGVTTDEIMKLTRGDE